MENSLESLTESFNAFFDGEAKVLILKGDWGVGKTYFWDKYIKGRIETRLLPQLAYSYVSLFGKNSLDDVKKSVFHNAKPLKTKEEVDVVFEQQETESSWFYERMPHIKSAVVDHIARRASWLGKLTRHTQELPFVGKFVNLASRFEYGYISNYLVCFDDLERKGKSLTVRDVMGLADELAQRKKCKVVIVFNEKSLEESKEDYSEFQSYREKVVDLEVVHSPSSKNNFNCVFEDGFLGRKELESAVVSMGVKNIRVLRKLKWMVEKFNVHISGSHALIREEFYLHSAVLCCEFFIRNKDLGYSEFYSRLASSSWMSTKQPDTGNPPADKRFGDLVTGLKLSGSAFDEHIDSFLQHGFLDSQSLNATILELEESIRRNTADYKLRSAWDIYSDSFDDNLVVFLSALKEVLDDDISRISLSDFSSAISVLSDFGEVVSEYIEKYLLLHGDSLKSKTDAFNWTVRRVDNSELSAALKELHHESIVMDLDQVTKRLSESNGWRPGDLDFLRSLEVNDYVTWMKTASDIYSKVTGGLYIFNNLSGSTNEETARFQKISSLVKESLVVIASENELNRMRVKNIYKVDV